MIRRARTDTTSVPTLLLSFKITLFTMFEKAFACRISEPRSWPPSSQMLHLTTIFINLIALVGFNAGAQVELRSGIDGKSHEPFYKVDHFSRNDQAWQTFFHNCGFRNEYSYNFLEVGSLEGRSAVWLLDNVLQHPDSRLSCVDMWNENIDNNEYNADLMKGIYNRFLHNVSPYLHKVDVYRGKSFDALRHPRLTEQSFDFVYVDGGHSSRNALEDAILSFGLLKVGGFMIFDDYFSNLMDPHNLNSPKLGIDTFLTMYSGSVSIVNIGYQLYVTKTAE